MTKYLTYLACPYSYRVSAAGIHKSFRDRIQELRANAATRAAVYLMNEFGFNVFSPITHSHPMAVIGGVQGDWEFWKEIDTEYLELSCRLVVLCIPGWKESIGVQAEIKIARELGIPVHYLQRKEGNYELGNTAPV